MLTVYRRHLRTCKSGHKEELRTTEFDERKKGFKRCDCPIFASGTLDKVSRRQNTGEWEWDRARPIAAQWEAAGSWTTKPAPLPARAPEPAQAGRITFQDAIKVFLTTREGAEIAAPTLRKYRTFARQLTTFADSKGYLMLDQFTPRDIDVYYSTLKLGPRAKSKRLSTIKSFFKFCVNREWIPKTPVSADIKAPIGSSRIANKSPFSDDELNRIVAACDRMPDVEWKSGIGAGVWTGKDIQDFIFVMVYTGLRISDVGLFNMSRVRGNEVFLRAKKNGGDVFAYLPDWLRDRLIERARRFGNRPFIVGRSERVDTITDTWRRKINEAFALAGEFEETPTPHRFRHTFARILLQKGVPVADVADLLGDDEKTVKTHYSRWVVERQERLTRILQDAFTNKPKPKIINMPSPR